MATKAKKTKKNQPEELRYSPSGDPLNEAAVKAEILRYCDESAQELRALFDELPNAAVMFVPAGGLNWEPVQRFSDICNVFIYADWTVNSHDCYDSIHQISGVCALDRQKLDELFKPAAVIANLPWLQAAQGGPLPEPWVEVARIRVRPVVGARTIWLIYLGGNPVEAYRAIFTHRQPQFSPRFILLRQPENVPQETWNAFAGADGQLQQAINENPRRPQRIITDI